MKGWRTILWNVANAVVPVLEIVQSTYSIPDEFLPYWLAVYVVGNVVLRLLTDTPVGRKA